MAQHFAGRSVIVTGATRGIGKGVARAFAAAGAQVLIVGRDEIAARATVGELSAQAPGRGPVSALVADVSDPDSAERIAAAAVDRHGGIDVLVANAAVFPSVPVEELTTDLVETVLRTNLVSGMLLVRACATHLADSGAGRVLLMSSITGVHTGYPGWSAYAASKAGQLGFMRTAALELAPRGITVNAILPGVVLTEGLRQAPAEHLERKAASIPLGRLGSVDDVAALALFLAGDGAGYITGQAVVVDGGQLLPESLTASPHPGAVA
jgi:3-oxoacyl-[acyl-carrier protein] reductase